MTKSHPELVARLATSNISTEDFSYLTTYLMESRTCENCKHWFMAITRDKNNNNTETPTCMLFAMSDDEYTIFTNKDFGCNKWERKDK